MSNTAHKPPAAETCEDLIRQMESLRRLVERPASLEGFVLSGLSAERRQSAQNLLHYLALRSQDLRSLQDSLARLGLSSLGRAEPHVLASIDAVLHNLYLLNGRQPPEIDAVTVYTSFDDGAARLEQNTIKALGNPPKKRRVHIMVTMPAEVAEDYMMVHQLLENGMDCIRINCAHDDASTWSAIIKNVRYAESATGQDCRILMDLDGPKMRTGPMESAPPVLKIRPFRASNGRVLRPARIWLTFAFHCQQVRHIFEVVNYARCSLCHQKAEDLVVAGCVVVPFCVYGDMPQLTGYGVCQIAGASAEA